MLQNGLYEQVINTALDKDLSETDRLVQSAAIDAAEAAKVLSKYITEVTEQQLMQLKDKGGDLKDQKAMLKKLARIAVSRGCGRLEWSCLDWNQPSIDFYLSLGAKPMDEWIVYRIAGDTLTEMANE